MMELFMEKVEGWFLLRVCKWFFWHLCTWIFMQMYPFLSEPLWGSPLGIAAAPLFERGPSFWIPLWDFYWRLMELFYGGIWEMISLCPSVSDSLTQVWVTLWHVCFKFCKNKALASSFINSLCPFGLNPFCMDPWPLFWGCPKDASCFERCLSICQIPCL